MSKIKKRISNNQKALVEQLKKTPVVTMACQKTGIGRSSYYRWCLENPKFSKLANEAIAEGSLTINDLAEVTIIGEIQKGNLRAVGMWLKAHHPKYGLKVEITNKQEVALTEADKKIIEKALELTFLPAPNEHEETREETTKEAKRSDHKKT